MSGECEQCGECGLECICHTDLTINEALRFAYSLRETQIQLANEIKSLTKDLIDLNIDNIGWISVKNYLPEIGKRVLVYQKDGITGDYEIIIQYRQFEEIWSDYGYHRISHWMPLPKVPESEDIECDQCDI